jgi:hypothetical protein
MSPPLPGNETKTITVKKSKPFTPSTLAAQPQGIRKKKPQPTRNQKRRSFKSMERAAVVMEQMEVKVARSEVKIKAVRSRRKDWENVNGDRKALGSGGLVMAGSRFGVLADEGDEIMSNDEEMWEEVREDEDGDREMTELRLRIARLESMPNKEKAHATEEDDIS